MGQPYDLSQVLAGFGNPQAEQQRTGGQGGGQGGSPLDPSGQLGQQIGNEARKSAQPENFIPRSSQRSPGEWGRPDYILNSAKNYPGVVPGPFMPQVGDATALIQKAGQAFAQLGSPGSAYYAIAMMNARSSYMKGVLQGQMQRAKLALDQQHYNQDKLLDDEESVQRHYGEIFETYKDDPATLDEKLRDYAYQVPGGPDKVMLEHLNQGGHARAEDLMKWRDDHWLALLKLREQRGKAADEEAKAASEKGWDDTDSTDDTSKGTSSTDPEHQPEKTETPTEKATDGKAASAGAPAGTKRPELYTAEADEKAFNGAVMPGGAKTDTEELGRWEMRGGKADEGTPKAVEDAAAHWKQRLQRQLDRAENSGLQGNDLLNRVRQIDGPTADLLESLHNNDRQVPGGGGFGAGQSPFWNNITNLMRKAFPDWKPQYYGYTQEALNDYKPGGAAGKVLAAIGPMKEASAQVLKALDDIDWKSNPPPAALWEMFKNKRITGDHPEWQRLAAAWNNYLQQSINVTRAGRSAEGDINRAWDISPLPSGEANIRSALIVDSADAYAKADYYNKYFQDNITHAKGNAPGFNVEDEKYFKTLRDNMDPYTGEIIGAPVPERLKGIVPKYTQRVSQGHLKLLLDPKTPKNLRTLRNFNRYYGPGAAQQIWSANGIKWDESGDPND
jgi:hypothetical protein